MKSLLLYRRTIFDGTTRKLPGVEKFLHYFKLYNQDVIPVDRTNTLKTPINLLNLFPLPKLVPYKKKYEDICNDRAKELLKKSTKLSAPIYVLYSGGIDSTLVLVSLIKNSNSVEREKINVLISQASITENPNFYENHILGKLNCLPSTSLRYILGTKNMLVTGEHNDQIFGSDIIADFIREFGEAAGDKKYDREKVLSFFNKRVPEPKLNLFYVNLFEELCSKSPVEIKTNFQFFWWINFALKWQNVSMRILMFTREKNITGINQEYIDKYLNHFYSTEDFQLWSMNNLDKKWKGTWKTYKWPCKEIIYNFTGDSEYRDNKIKYGSLGSVIVGTHAMRYIEEGFRLTDTINTAEYFNPNNSFL